MSQPAGWGARSREGDEGPLVVIRTVLGAKIHRATVTVSAVEYEGSCSIDEALMAAAGIVEGEQIHVANLTNGQRGITYVIPGAPGEIGLNGAMAHLGEVGDRVILMTYVQVDERERAALEPRIVHVDEHNRPRALPVAALASGSGR